MTDTMTLDFAFRRGAHLTQEEQDQLMQSMSAGSWNFLKIERENGLKDQGYADPNKIHWTEACAFPNSERFVLIDASGEVWQVDPLKGAIKKMVYVNETEEGSAAYIREYRSQSVEQ